MDCDVDLSAATLSAATPSQLVAHRGFQHAVRLEFANRRITTNVILGSAWARRPLALRSGRRTYHRGRFVLPKSESTYLIVLAMIPPWMDYFFSMLEAFSLFEFRWCQAEHGGCEDRSRPTQAHPMFAPRFLLPMESFQRPLARHSMLVQFQ